MRHDNECTDMGPVFHAVGWQLLALAVQLYPTVAVCCMLQIPELNDQYESAVRTKSDSLVMVTLLQNVGLVAGVGVVLILTNFGGEFGL
jgi:hypothetical protein